MVSPHASDDEESDREQQEDDGVLTCSHITLGELLVNREDEQAIAFG